MSASGQHRVSADTTSCDEEATSDIPLLLYDPFNRKQQTSIVSVRAVQDGSQVVGLSTPGFREKSADDPNYLVPVQRLCSVAQNGTNGSQPKPIVPGEPFAWLLEAEMGGAVFADFWRFDTSKDPGDCVETVQQNRFWVNQDAFVGSNTQPRTYRMTNMLLDAPQNNADRAPLVMVDSSSLQENSSWQTIDPKTHFGYLFRALPIGRTSDPRNPYALCAPLRTLELMRLEVLNQLGVWWSVGYDPANPDRLIGYDASSASNQDVAPVSFVLVRVDNIQLCTVAETLSGGDGVACVIYDIPNPRFWFEDLLQGSTYGTRACPFCFEQRGPQLCANDKLFYRYDDAQKACVSTPDSWDGKSFGTSSLVCNMLYNPDPSFAPAVPLGPDPSSLTPAAPLAPTPSPPTPAAPLGPAPSPLTPATPLEPRRSPFLPLRPANSRNKKQRVGLIVGLTVGGVLFLALVLGLLVFFGHKQKRYT